MSDPINWEEQEPLHEGCPMDDTCEEPECVELMVKFWEQFEPHDEDCEECRTFPCVCAFSSDEYGYDDRLC